jgi:hypothetical protein
MSTCRRTRRLGGLVVLLATCLLAFGGCSDGGSEGVTTATATSAASEGVTATTGTSGGFELTPSSAAIGASVLVEGSEWRANDTIDFYVFVSDGRTLGEVVQSGSYEILMTLQATQDGRFEFSINVPESLSVESGATVDVTAGSRLAIAARTVGEETVSYAVEFLDVDEP